MEIEHNSNPALKALICRIVRLEADLREVYAEAKSQGFDMKIFRNGIMTEKVINVRELADAGYTLSAIATAMGWSYIYASQFCTKHYIRIIRKKRSDADGGGIARNAEILKKYRDGVTLQSIGDQHLITGERVRQIIMDHGEPMRRAITIRTARND